MSNNIKEKNDEKKSIAETPKEEERDILFREGKIDVDQYLDYEEYKKREVENMKPNTGELLLSNVTVDQFLMRLMWYQLAFGLAIGFILWIIGTIVQEMQ